MTVEEYVKMICSQLELDDVPEISYDTSKFVSDTMQACVKKYENVIYIRKN